MLHRLGSSAFALSVACLAAAPGAAQTLPFEGTRENVNPVTPPGGRCVPPFFNTVNIAPGAISSTGTSNLGTFTSTQTHCITSAPPTDVVDGQFTYMFRAGDSIIGTYSGSVANSGTPGVFTATENLVITAGTGRFVGASGIITSTGSLRFGQGPTGIFQGTLTGSLNASQATASGAFATALGEPSAATGDYATSVGAFSIAAGARSSSLGAFAEATGLNATAIGSTAIAAAEQSTAVGALADATAPGAQAFGYDANATGTRSLAVGNLALATNNLAAAVGPSSTASGLNASAFGPFTVASGMGSVAVGNVATATNAGATAVGVRTFATADFATSVGRRANASAVNATAIGADAIASFAGSTSLGFTASSTAANQVVLGGTGSHVRVGDIAASTAAQQTSSIGVATVDGNGVLGRDTLLLPTVAALQSSSTSQQSAINAIQSGLSVQQNLLADLASSLGDARRGIREANEGVAMALALDTPAVPAGASFSLSGGIGNFKGRTALAAAISAAVSEMASVSAGLGYGFDSRELGTRAGFQVSW